jgi:hypothetical protein
MRRGTTPQFNHGRSNYAKAFKSVVLGEAGDAAIANKRKRKREESKEEEESQSKEEDTEKMIDKEKEKEGGPEAGAYNFVFHEKLVL